MGQSLLSEAGAHALAGAVNGVVVRVRVVRTEEQLAQVARLRYCCYARAIPALADSMRAPDAADRSRHAIVLLAQDADTGMPLATVRIEQAGHGPYVPRDLLELPDDIPVEATTYYSRLAAVGGRAGTSAKLSMMKAAARYSLAVGKPWVLAAAPPGRHRNYSMLGLKPLTGVRPVPMPGHPDIRLSLLGGNLFDAERESRRSDRTFLRFVFDPVAPEIEVFESICGAWIRPRADRAQLPAMPAVDADFGLVVV